jgi:hypothetical protein
MSSRSATEVLYQRVMEETGFYRNGVPTGGVIEAESLRNDNQQLEKRIKYSPVIDPEQINATAIFELSGSPCIYFTQLEQSNPDPRELARLHKLSWNHGLAPMLWVVTPTNVRLYNCYSEPTEDNPESNLIALFENTEASLKQLNEHASRLQLESGEFWQWQNARKIDRKKRVDRVLVEDLHASEKKLRAEGLESQVAHALLMRSIFVAYLQDRGILDTQFFRSRFDVDSFTDLLSDTSATNILFEWLKVTFNGDMFPVSSEEVQNSYEARHLEIVKDLVGGRTEIATGQGRLWRFYDFKVIPVELMSSIYENFLYSKDAQAAKELSVHYTPINLVDLVLDEVFKDLNGSAKVLDLSCGSGVFLVESLRRLVVKRWMNGEERSRELIRDTLYNQIYGVDVEPQATQIAAFSLYLTALELDYELDRNAPISDELKFRELIGRNLFSSNTFDESATFNKLKPFVSRSFDAIVGNPPWTQSKANNLTTDYCARKRPDEGYPNGYPIARSQNPDQAFLWRIGDFSSEKTKIGLLLHGKPFFSQTPKAHKAKEALLKRFRPLVMVNLSNLREEWIFPGSRAPTLILIAECRPAEPNDSFHFACPDRSFDFNRHGIIEISPENIKRLSVDGAATDPDMLKVASWGGARDLCLIQKLKTEFLCIDEVIGKPLSNGFKTGTGKRVPEEMLSKKWLPSGKMPKYQVDLDKLELLPYLDMEAPRKMEIYNPPLVIISQTPNLGGIYSAFSQESIVYTQKYSGISLAQKDIRLAHYLNAVINSSVISYFIFLTASSWGVERDEVTLQDFLRIPVPTPSTENVNLVSKIVAIEHQLRTTSSTEHQSLKYQLNEAVFELYALDQTERVLVEDGVNLTISLRMERESSIALRKPTLDDLKLYALQLIGVIQPFLQILRERVLVAEVIEVSNSPLQVVKFSFLPAPAPAPAHIVKTTQAQKLKAVLNRIAEHLPQQIADQIYTRRDLRIYTGQDIYIVKPAQKRCWSRSVGLNDADLILSEHLRVNCAAIG